MIKNGMAVLALALATNLAHADDYLSPTEERVRLSMGAMYLSSTTSLRLDPSQGQPGTGTPINAENDLGLDSGSVEPKFQAMVRVGERHRLRFDYFSLDRTGQTTIVGVPPGSPIIFGDVILLPGDPANSSLSLRTLGISYEYSFIHNQKFELAATLGVNDTGISTRVRVSTATRHVDQKEDEAGPIPSIGLDSTYVLSKRFYLDARAQYFKVNVDNMSGSQGFYEFAALYRFRPNVSFALGYTAAVANIDSQKQPDKSGSFNSKGPEFFVRVAF